MDLQEGQISDLTARIRNTVASGKAVAIYGWLNRKNHNKFTRSLSEDLVRFDANPPRKLGETIGLAIFTPYSVHTNYQRLKNESRDVVHPTVLNVSVIRTVLESCGDILVQKRLDMSHKTQVEQETEPISQPEDNDDMILDIAISLLKEKSMSAQRDSLISFANAFSATATKSKKEGLVSAAVVRRLLEENNVEGGIRPLVSSGVLSRVDNPNDTGVWYSKGEKFVTASDEEIEPTDPIERARFRISRRPKLLAELEIAEAEVAAIKQELSAIETIEKKFAEIVEVLSFLES